MTRGAPVLSRGSETVVLPRVLSGEGACGEEYVRLIAELNDIRNYYERGVQESADREGLAEKKLAVFYNTVPGANRAADPQEHCTEWIVGMVSILNDAAMVRALIFNRVLAVGVRRLAAEEQVSEEKVAPAEGAESEP